jgi:hypothetical protein
VPTLKALLPWSQKQFGVVHPHVLSWLSLVRHKLESATATRPAPPADWARRADVPCTCQYCAQLNAFLADPAAAVGRIKAREETRQHVLGLIDRHRCDVEHDIDRKTSPHSLVLTKTNASYERAAQRFEADCQLLQVLDEVGAGIGLQNCHS